MRRFTRAILVGLLSTLLPSTAEASFAVSFDTTPTGFHPYNGYEAELTSAGVSGMVSAGSSVVLTEASTITFEVLGAAGGYVDSFTAAGLPTYTEASLDNTNDFGSPIYIGTGTFDAGSLAGLLWFTGPGKKTVTLGDLGFGIYLPAGFTSGSEVNTLYLGYDDEPGDLADGDYNDLFIRATVSSAAVPEPATWLMLLCGFGFVGAMLRRRKASMRKPGSPVTQASIA